MAGFVIYHTDYNEVCNGEERRHIWILKNRNNT